MAVSLNQYDRSLTELKAIEKRLSMNTITIRTDRLDDKTKNDIIMGITKIVAERKKAVLDVIQGASVG